MGSELNTFVSGLTVQNRHLGLKIWRLDIRDQTPFKAGAQPVDQPWDFLRGTVARDDDLLSDFVERVEGVKEFFLCSLLGPQNLNVIHQKRIDRSEPFMKGGHLVITERVD